MNRLPGSCQPSRYLKKIVFSLCLASSLLAAATVVPLTAIAHGQSLSNTPRAVQGKVYGSNGQIKSGAVVYLKNEKSLEIKTFISGQDGAYRFGQLGSQDDYLLWAEAEGHKSKNKNISSFDSKKTFFVDLHLEDK